MTFEDNFAAGGAFQCFLWADDPTLGRVRFEIGADVLTDVLGGGNPVHDADNVAVCERERAGIEAACRRAAERAPGQRVRLMPGDFA